MEFPWAVFFPPEFGLDNSPPSHDSKQPGRMKVNVQGLASLPHIVSLLLHNGAGGRKSCSCLLPRLNDRLNTSCVAPLGILEVCAYGLEHVAFCVQTSKSNRMFRLYDWTETPDMFVRAFI